MNDIGQSIAEWIQKRSTSAALGAYTFFWAVIHWQGIYTTLFVGQDLIYQKFGLLKNEYVAKYFFGYHNFWGLIWGLLIPLLLAVIFIWPLPKFVLIYAYQVEQEHKTDRMRVKYKQEQVRRSFEIKQINQETAKVEAKTELSTKRKAATKVDPAITWESEYKEFEQDPAFMSYRYILESIYEHNGLTKVYDQYQERLEFEIPGGALMLADTNGLIVFNNQQNTIQLTDKGKLFARKYPHYAGR